MRHQGKSGERYNKNEITYSQFVWLATLIEHGPINEAECGFWSGFDVRGRSFALFTQLAKLGMVERSCGWRWHITERGKIAYAIQCGKNARAGTTRRRRRRRDLTSGTFGAISPLPR